MIICTNLCSTNTLSNCNLLPGKLPAFQLIQAQAQQAFQIKSNQFCGKLMQVKFIMASAIESNSKRAFL